MIRNSSNEISTAGRSTTMVLSSLMTIISPIYATGFIQDFVTYLIYNPHAAADSRTIYSSIQRI
jgi:hypothetical protein